MLKRAYFYVYVAVAVSFITLALAGIPVFYIAVVAAVAHHWNDFWGNILWTPVQWYLALLWHTGLFWLFYAIWVLVTPRPTGTESDRQRVAGFADWFYQRIGWLNDTQSLRPYARFWEEHDR